jgi:hypothetical protein
VPTDGDNENSHGAPALVGILAIQHQQLRNNKGLRYSAETSDTYQLLWLLGLKTHYSNYASIASIL